MPRSFTRAEVDTAPPTASGAERADAPASPVPLGVERRSTDGVAERPRPTTVAEDMAEHDADDAVPYVSGIGQADGEADSYASSLGQAAAEGEAAPAVAGEADGGPVAVAPVAARIETVVRRHRAWLLSRIKADYQDETVDNTRTGLEEKARAFATLIATLRDVLDKLTELGAARGRLPIVNLLPAGHAARFAVTNAEALALVTKSYEDSLVSVQRQELPIDDRGALGDLSSRLVEYDAEGDAQERTAVRTGGGRLWRTDGSTPVDTTDSVTHTSGPGVEIFAVDESNVIHMTSHKLGKVHHSSLLAGKPVSVAGEMKVTAGKIDWMSNKSGHYVPSLVQLQLFLHQLGKDLPLDFEIRESKKLGAPGIIPDRTTAQQLLDGIAPDRTVDPARGHDHQKTQAVTAAWIDQIGPGAVADVITEQGWTMSKELGGEYLVTDSGGQPVPDRDVRRALKAARPGERPRTERQP